MKIFAILLIVVAIILGGCSVFGGPGPEDPVTEEQLTSTQKSQEKAFAGLRWMMYAGVTLAAFGLGVLFLPGLRSYSVPFLASGGFMAFFSIMLNQHYLLISWIGLALGLAGIALLVWMVWKNKDKLEAAGTALIQVVTGNEISKKLLPDDIKKRIYGSDDLNSPSIARSLQTSKTVDLVTAIRRDINEKET